MRISDWRGIVTAGLTCALGACVGARTPEEPETIPRDVFVDAYVELRLKALRTPGGRIGPTAKEEVLEARGITEAELAEFVDAHGPRVQFMADVWAEIDDSLRRMRTREDAPPAS